MNDYEKMVLLNLYRNCDVTTEFSFKLALRKFLIDLNLLKVNSSNDVFPKHEKIKFADVEVGHVFEAFNMKFVKVGFPEITTNDDKKITPPEENKYFNAFHIDSYKMIHFSDDEEVEIVVNEVKQYD